MRRGKLRIKNNHGAVGIMVILSFITLLGFGVLAVDVGHLYVVRNELQNAADAGALAGAGALYVNNGTAIDANANTVAQQIAAANLSEKVAVEVDADQSTGDVQRGHWSFASRAFTPNASLATVDLWGVSTAALDADPNFINAVRVRVHRQATPATTFLAAIFGSASFSASAEAIAYIGFAGTLGPGDADQPIAICQESILQNGAYSCSIGRMINSGSNVASSETGGWTSFSQNDPCTGGTNAQEVTSLVCSGGNPGMITLGDPIATNGGEIQSSFTALRNCWINTTGQISSWNLTLPVVTCPGNNVGTCEEVVGAVNINIVWITGPGADPNYTDAPMQMDSWDGSGIGDLDGDGLTGDDRWASFTAYFHLQNVDVTGAPYQKKAI